MEKCFTRPEEMIETIGKISLIFCVKCLNQTCCKSQLESATYATGAYCEATEKHQWEIFKQGFFLWIINVLGLINNH